MSDEWDLLGYSAAFLDIAQAASQLPEDKRVEVSNQLGTYTHDLKHLLGLVTGANEIILRHASSDEPGGKIVEMVEIIQDATIQMDAYFDLLVDNLYHPIVQES